MAAKELALLSKAELSGRTLADANLRELLQLPVADRKAAILERLSEVYSLALSRRRIQANGMSIEDPDCHAAIKALEVAGRLLEVDKPLELPRGLGIPLSAIFAEGSNK